MSKKINLGTINNVTINALSTFHVAIIEAKKASKAHSEKNKALNEELEKQIAKRDEAIKSGKTPEEAINEFSVELIYKKINAENERYKKAMKALNDDKKEGYSLLSDALYSSYLLAMKRGDFNATGKLKDVSVEKSFKALVKEFLTGIGCDAENNTALDKFVNTMVVRVAGMKKASATSDDYVVSKSKRQFNELFLLCFLQYTIVDKGVITVNDDNTLSMTIYND